MGRLYEAGGGAGGLVDEGLPCRAGCRHRFWRLVAMVAMMASMRWASAAAAGACTAVLAASGWACGWQSGFGLGGWVWGRSGRMRLRIRRQWGAVARTSCGATRACGSAARKGRLAGGVGNVGTVSARKGRVQECRRRRSQLLASERAESLLLVWGRPSREDSESSQGFGSSKFPVERTLGYLSPLGWRPEGGSGGGSRQVLASASGGTVLSDQRRGASETGTVPTARVCHKEPICPARCRHIDAPSAYEALTLVGGGATFSIS